MTDDIRIEAPIRLAMRVEGDYWTAWLARHGTMEGAQRLASVHLKVVENQDRREALRRLLSEFVMDVIEEHAGARPTAMSERPAPDHECERKDAP